MKTSEESICSNGIISASSRQSISCGQWRMFLCNMPAKVIKVYNEDNTSRAVEVPTDITARDICQLFVMKNHCIDDHSWTLFEHLSHLGIERTIEDHESVMEVLSGWGMDTDSRLYFRKNYAKYEFFNKPLDFFPDHMVSLSSETNGIMNHSQLIQVSIKQLSTCLHFKVTEVVPVSWTQIKQRVKKHFRRDSIQILRPSVLPIQYLRTIFCPTDISQLKHLSRDPWAPPCQRTRQEVLEEVLLCLEEVRSLLLKQGDIKGTKASTVYCRVQ
uniref:Growth factor receptor bound protein 14 n=1 Tax=Hucho hucho TaxID=62062 RepID=A0A4W5RWU8_9TELE